MVNVEGSSRLSKESLNALRFRNLTKKYLLDDDQVDAVKLKQLIHSASIVSERLATANTCNDNDTHLRSQLDELKGELSKKRDLLNEIGIAKAKADSKMKFSVSSSQTIVSKSAQITSQDGVQDDQTENDAASGERIHTLLQQQKVTQWSAELNAVLAIKHLYFNTSFFHSFISVAYFNTRIRRREKSTGGSYDRIS